MENNVQRKARLILAGLAVMPAMASAAMPEVQANGYSSPYGENEELPVDLMTTTGLTRAELQEGKDLVRQLNQLDVISVREINLTQAPTVPYRYGIPDPQDLSAARSENLERLVKLRNIIEAAK